ncbi:MAG: SPOR domain-containing protein [Kangiellaceae bacterium]|nr:SPOR domain-containing protein [Kangiellaceae bacterium]MCW9000830.1 SPOR domain-containing protein [Kangiellaceae bacterium]MCW9016215.1 SPOR domain-containing protein [Kangiellaceae bacterium]
MPKDYAKKRKPKKRGASRQSKKNAVSIGVWFVAFVFVGGLTAGLVYLKWFNPQPIKKAVEKKAVQQKTQPMKAVDGAAVGEDEVPIYNIHKDLTNKKVEIPAEDLKPSEDINKYVYLMPCGSFRESTRAEELKAKIGFTGNNSQVNPVKYKGETWYRVELGPFSRKRTAEKVRHRLQDNGIHDCRIIPRLREKQ